jgi:pyridinium-3,5-bisthiocarboxylic acid mononucleotide nickel chelatase
MPIRSEALLLETILPDASRFIDVLIERVLAAGAIEVWTSPIVDSHGRPGVRLSMVSLLSRRDEIEAVIVTNSSAGTILATAVEVTRVETSSEPVTTRWGDIEITHRRHNGRIIDIEPDAASCAAIARAHDIPANTVWNEAYRIGEARIGQKR